jgi:hypothetical protein
MAISATLEHNAISYRSEQGGIEHVNSSGRDSDLLSGDNVLKSRLRIPQSGMIFMPVADTSATC